MITERRWIKWFTFLIKGGDVLELNEDSSVTRPTVRKEEKVRTEEVILIGDVRRSADPVWIKGALWKTAHKETKMSQRIGEVMKSGGPIKSAEAAQREEPCSCLHFR
jgi:hypothetical protein